jgi:hypothetical protein
LVAKIFLNLLIIVAIGLAQNLQSFIEIKRAGIDVFQ